MNIVTLYESQSTDGYTHSGDGVYFITEVAAEQHAQVVHGAYAATPMPRKAILCEDGRYLLLKSDRPISIKNSKQAKEDFKNKALAKLTKAEREALELE
jgi:hypothetical protein